MIAPGAARSRLVGLGNVLILALLAPVAVVGELQVIGAGLPRTGTESLASALAILGYKNVMHDSCNPPTECQRAACEWMVNGTKEAILEEVRRQQWEAVTDEPMNFLHRELADAFPDSKVILTTRDSAEDWYRSFSRMQGLNWAPIVEDRGILHTDFGFHDLDFWATCDQSPHKLIGCPIFFENQTEEVRQKCLRGYDDFVEQVKSSTPPERLLVFNVKEGWAPLCKFLGRPVPSEPFPRNNRYMQYLEWQHAVREFQQKLRLRGQEPLQPGSK